VGAHAHDLHDRARRHRHRSLRRRSDDDSAPLVEPSSCTPAMSVPAEMKDWIRDAEQYDDLTVIVMKVR
jgi:hypothetical protein